MWRRLGSVFEAIGRRPADRIEKHGLNDPFWDFRRSVCWGVITIGGGLGVVMFMSYPNYLKQVVVSAFGVVSLVAAIVALRAKTKPDSIRRTWWAVAWFAVFIGLMVLVENLWPPMFPSICYDC